MKKISIYSTFSLLLLVILFKLGSAAEAEKKLDIVGMKEFVNYCASCHGSEGKGNGPIVHFLKNKPTDLTQLSKNNNGTFPFERIWGVFDGTHVFAEHGTSEMPIWGYRFIREAQKENRSTNEAKAKALNIVLYLQVIQE